MGSYSGVVCLLQVMVATFFCLILLNEEYPRDAFSVNHKLNSLFSFGEMSANSTGGVHLADKIPNENCPHLKRTHSSWADEKSAYNAKDDIYLDWNADSHLFTYLNYKSLESALVSYPKSRFSLIIVGPNAANYYKINDLLSKHQFQKYKKRGYHITPVVVDDVKAPMDSRLTMQYWSLQQPQYCSTKGKKRVHDVKTAPYHVWFYVKLQKLLSSGGGLSFDFSWLHLKPLTSNIFCGYKIATTCSAARSSKLRNINRSQHVLLSSSSSLQNPYSGTILQDIEVQTECYTTSFIALRKRYFTDKTYEKILFCMLSMYDDFEGSSDLGTLINCFEKDLLTGGAICLEILLRDCFSQHAVNQFANGDGDENVLNSSLISPEEKRLVTFNWQSDIATQWQIQTFHSRESSDSSCFVHSFLHYLHVLNSTYANLFKTCKMETIFTLDSSFILNGNEDNEFHTSAVWFGRNLGQYKHNMRNSLVPTKLINVPFSKLEIQKYSIDWFIPKRNHVVTAFLRMVEARLCLPIGRSDGSTRDTCSTYYPDRLVDKAHDIVTDVQNKTPEISRLGISCSISFVVPGFMKCASSFLFEALTNHPQVLRALKGVNFKETGCYLPPSSRAIRVDNAQHRMNCFPFVEAHESRFVYGDATVTYSSSYDVPYALKKDNYYIKSIFVVRDPIQRLESHFRFSLSLMKSLGFDSVDKAVTFALRPENYLHSLHNDSVVLLENLRGAESFFVNKSYEAIVFDDCLKNLWVLFFRYDVCAKLQVEAGRSDIFLHTEDKISQYIQNFFIPHNVQDKKERVTNLIVRTSIYFPVIAHWSFALRPENVLVVDSEKLDLSTKAKRQSVVLELKRIHRFLNISEEGKSVPGQTIHKTTNGAVESAVSGSCRAALKDFYRPFNELLGQLIRILNLSPYDVSYI